MSKQIYYSFIIAALSFITVKRIQKAGVEEYHFLQTLFQKENGWFNFNQPEFIKNLPFELNDISAIFSISDSKIACVQDQNGNLLLINLENDSVVGQYNFGCENELIGLTRVDSSYFALRRDATLLEMKAPWDSSSIIETKLNTQSFDKEILCFDERENRLLFATDSYLNEVNFDNELRIIYSIDLETKQLIEAPLFEFKLSEIESFASENKLELPQKISKLFKDTVTYLDFIPSSIAVHPKTDEIYLLSSIDKTMAVFDKKGNIMNYVLLDKTIFTNPQRILFQENGDLFISNSAPLGTSSLLKFQWKKIVK